MLHEQTALALGELEGMAVELAQEIHIPENRPIRLLAGKRAIPANTAPCLALWLGVRAMFWMNLQKICELDRASAEIGPEVKCTIHRRILTSNITPSGQENWRRRNKQARSHPTLPDGLFYCSPVQSSF